MLRTFTNSKSRPAVEADLLFAILLCASLLERIARLVRCTAHAAYAALGG